MRYGIIVRGRGGGSPVVDEADGPGRECRVVSETEGEGRKFGVAEWESAGARERRGKRLHAWWEACCVGFQMGDAGARLLGDG